MIINFQCRDEILIKKMLGRRMCPACNKNFNVADIVTEDGYELPPMLPKGSDITKCDAHGAEDTEIGGKAITLIKR